ncbi:MAG: HAMP domain-containing sensor histidine kinase [Saprospiraceae bacterium]|nr:HAMP domain-containing sensor histidine kinase [Saprospiraceae bacterium]
MPHKRVPIKFKLAVIINTLVVPLLLLLSFLFYWQFRNALDERVLLQLSSIKQLKSVQIEDFLRQEWTLFGELYAARDDRRRAESSIESDIMIFDTTDHLDDPALSHLLSLDQDGIHDLSFFSPDGRIMVGYYLRFDSSKRAVRISPAEKIQQILLERTGMGETGETYLVGPDFKLRSQSRFFPDINPIKMHAKTHGVVEALEGFEGRGIFPDYRNIMVFSAYSVLNVGLVRWVILSELDKSEAHQPLESMRNRLIMILIIVVSITIFGSFILARSLVKPLVRMKARLSEMSLGNFSIESLTNYRRDEIGDMFKALDEVVASIRQAMRFASAIGSMQLDTKYEILSEHDSLGQALINMQEKLKEFKHQEEQIQLSTQKTILRSQEKDRERLSREMHDGLGPLLTSLRMIVQQLDISTEERGKIKSILDETIGEVRRMTYNLMPQALVDFGVGEALANLTKLSAKISGISIKYTHTMKSDSRFPDEVNIGLYRIAQEVLNNALKHSGACEIKMSLTEFDDRISFYFVDDGNGFDIYKMYPGAGLINIRERCRILRGSINLTSNQDGTSIEIEIPLQND